MKLCVIGHPIAHSKSPFIHQEFAKQAGLAISYEKVLVPIDRFSQSVAGLKAQGISGCNVTLPFKEKAFDLADSCSERAKKAGAANVLVFREGVIFADNTDGIGLVRDVQNNIGYLLRGKRILICGAGGAVRGILYPIMQERPASIVIANRTWEKAVVLAKAFSDIMPIEALSYQALASRKFDVIIDGTSFAKEALALPDSMELSAGGLYYDLKYKKEVNDTLFLDWAKAQGGSIVTDGIGMLVEQAAESFKIWTGLMPHTAPVIEKLRKLFYEN